MKTSDEILGELEAMGVRREDQFDALVTVQKLNQAPTKEEELCILLDVVFDSAQEPDWSAVQEYAYLSKNNSWLMTELLRLMWLCAQDQAAFDEEIWRLTNEAQ